MKSAVLGASFWILGVCLSIYAGVGPFIYCSVNNRRQFMATECSHSYIEVGIIACHLHHQMLL